MSSVADLRREATRLQIKGRSKLKTKKDLLAAIAKHKGSEKRLSKSKKPRAGKSRVRKSRNKKSRGRKSRKSKVKKRLLPAKAAAVVSTTSLMGKLGINKKPSAAEFRKRLEQFKNQTRFSKIGGGHSSEKWGDVNFFEKCLREEYKLSTSELDKLRKVFEKSRTYKGISRLGVPGKDGIALRLNCGGTDYALKFFVPKKNHKKIKNEALFQQMAANIGISPKIYAVKLPENKTQYPYIAMEIVKGPRFVDFKERSVPNPVISAKDGRYMVIKPKVQKEIYEIFDKLDSVGVLHNDGNILNLMWDSSKDKPVLIDYGFGKLFSLKDLKNRGPNPNIDTTLYAMLLGSRHHGFKAQELRDMVDEYDEKFGMSRPAADKKNWWELLARKS